MRWKFQILLGGIRTDCPLCRGPARCGQLCLGCYEDIFLQRQQRALCQGCAGELQQSSNFKADTQTPYLRARCQACQRTSASYNALVCALETGFPASLMLDRWSRKRSDLSLAPVFAGLVWQACQYHSKTEQLVPDCWIAMPADSACLQRCQCSPAHELARALSHLTGIKLRSGWLAFEQMNEVTSKSERQFLANARVSKLSIGLVLDQLETLDQVQRAASALRAAGAQQVFAVCAAQSAMFWQNHAHVSCDIS